MYLKSFTVDFSNHVAAFRRCRVACRCRRTVVSGLSARASRRHAPSSVGLSRKLHREVANVRQNQDCIEILLLSYLFRSVAHACCCSRLRACRIRIRMSDKINAEKTEWCGRLPPHVSSLSGGGLEP